MGKPIEDPLANQCGNCAFWDKIPNHPQGNVGECCGIPPTPVVRGMKPKQFGRPGETDIHIELVRPMMASNARPCALHKKTIMQMIGGKLDS